MDATMIHDQAGRAKNSFEARSAAKTHTRRTNTGRLSLPLIVLHGPVDLAGYAHRQNCMLFKNLSWGFGVLMGCGVCLEETENI